MFHLHCLQHQQQLALADPFALADQHLDDGAVHRRLERAGTGADLGAGAGVGDVEQFEVAAVAV